ncbi:MAG: flagellar basal body-associated FliL family protein [Bdellovibrionales bacterium]|nr:flagellar basal body-associated FliL family protein [Bdellovibrionales bacterium]
MSDNPEKSAETKLNDAASNRTADEGPALSPILIDELETEELEEIVSVSHPPIRAPRIKELLESQDPPSRFITYLSIAFALLAAACLGVLVKKYLDIRAAHKPAITEEVKLTPEKIYTQALGEFRLILKGVESPNDGELRIDMTAECSTQDACDYLKGHIAQTRDIVIPVLVNVRREEVLNPESKNLMRRRIAEQLNSLPMKGKIIQILFTDLTVEDAPDS